MLASLLIVGHTAPLGHHDRVCLRQPGAGEPVADELDLARLATVPLVSVIEIRAHRLRRRRAQRLLVRARVPAQAGDQRQWQSDREHPGALRHDDALGPLQRRVHVATRLTLGQPMLDLKRAHRVRWRAPAKQRNRAVDAHGVLVCMRSPKRHQPLEYYTSRPTPFRRATDRPLELEIRYCVGAVVSPLLANVYLHYVFDLWAERWRRRYARGDVIIVRFADDYIVGFEHERDAQRFLADLRDRVAKFGLELAAEKTRLIEFGRFAAERRQARGLGKPETFNFLGFTHICAEDRSGRFALKRITDSRRMRAKLRQVKQELARRRHQPIPEQGRWLASVVRGHCAYYAVPGNSRAVRAFRTQATRHWCAELRRRGQRHRLDWQRMNRIATRSLPPAHISHPFPERRFDAGTRGRSPVR